MMRSKKRNRLKQALELMRENENKYADLIWWYGCDQKFELEQENYEALRRAKEIELKYPEDISILKKDINEDTNWQHGFNTAMFDCSALFFNIIEFGKLLPTDNLELVGSEILKSICLMNKENRIKETLKLINNQEDKYFQIIHYSRMK